MIFGGTWLLWSNLFFMFLLHTVVFKWYLYKYSMNICICLVKLRQFPHFYMHNLGKIFENGCKLKCNARYTDYHHMWSFLKTLFLWLELRFYTAHYYSNMVVTGFFYSPVAVNLNMWFLNDSKDIQLRKLEIQVTLF